jgi:hypothetical protein
MDTKPVQQRKDKKHVVDEVWTPERVRSFLDLQPPAGIDADYHRLLRAYQSMRADDFEDFIQLFLAAGGKLDARGPDNQTLLEEIRRHRHGAPFAEILRAAGG